MSESSQLPTGYINAKVVIRILGRSSTKPDGAAVDQSEAFRPFTWLDIGFEEASIASSTEQHTSVIAEYDHQSIVDAGRAAAAAGDDWDEDAYTTVFIEACFRAFERIGESAASPSHGRRRPGPKGNASDDNNSEGSFAEDVVEHFEDCEAEVKAIEEAEETHRQEMIARTHKHRRDTYAAQTSNIKRKLTSMEADRLQWEDMLKMGYVRWQEEQPEEAAAFKIHLHNACIYSQALVRIYDILRWMASPHYVKLPLREVSRHYREQAILLYRLHHLELGANEHHCRLDHRLDDRDFAAIHKDHAAFGLEKSDFRNGWTDHLGRYEGRMALIHMVIGTEVRTVRVQGAKATSDDYEARHTGQRVMGWYEVAHRWENKQCFRYDASPPELREFSRRVRDRWIAMRDVVAREVSCGYTSDYDPTHYEDRRDGDPKGGWGGP